MATGLHPPSIPIQSKKIQKISYIFDNHPPPHTPPSPLPSTPHLYRSSQKKFKKFRIILTSTVYSKVVPNFNPWPLASTPHLYRSSQKKFKKFRIILTSTVYSKVVPNFNPWP